MFEFLVAFGAGLVSFLSPCVLPLIPGYISYISGQSLQNILETKKINLFSLILFCLGFSSVFVILGASASFFGTSTFTKFRIVKDNSWYNYNYFLTSINWINKYSIFEF